MRRLARPLFTICSAASLLLCVAVGVLWVRSDRVTDQLVWLRADGTRFLQTARGHVWLQVDFIDLSAYSPDDFGLEYRSFPAIPAPHFAFSFLAPDPNLTGTSWRWGGFEWHTLSYRGQMKAATGVARCSSLVMTTALLPLAWTALRLRSIVRKRRRNRMGLCSACGYDLRASPQRC